MTKDIQKCCICGTHLQTGGGLKFYELLGSGSEWYEQRLGICPNCGLIVTMNPFTPEQLERRYKKESKYEYDKKTYVGGIKSDYIEQCKQQKFFIDSNVHGDYESILEVGAASGYNLSCYPGKRVLGIEPSDLNCRLARQNYGVMMFSGMWSEYYQQKGSDQYDIIFLSMVLEHIVNPFTFIQECAKVCSKYMFIYVPTLDVKFVEEPFGMFAEEHVNIFTLESLHAMMRKAGFSLMDAEMLLEWKHKLPSGYPSLMTLWKKGGKDDLPALEVTAAERLDHYWKKNEEKLAEVQAKLKKIPTTERLALWGVGHHVSMLLANTCLREKNIVAIFDSDERKKGMSFIGHEIVPFSIEYMEEHHIDAILLTTYTAQDAILRQLRQMSFSGKVYTLYD